MIYRLRKKFIRICVTSFLTVFTLIFGTLYAITYRQAAVDADNLADLIMGNGGTFPERGAENFDSARTFLGQTAIGPEAPFTTRFFVVRFDPLGQVISANTSSIVSVTPSEAVSYGHRAMGTASERGWIDMYRYKTVATPSGTSVVFIHNDNLKKSINLIFASGAVILLGGGLIFFAFVIVFSKRAVKPVAESYEKQKRFITDANHELKTPLTLMLTNLDIVESELGPNEWLEDIRAEGSHMAELIARLTELARMDEDSAPAAREWFSLSAVARETAEEFAPAAEQRGLTLTWEADPEISYWGVEREIRELISVLVENAVKYCDRGGTVTLRLKKEKKIRLTVDNSYSAVGTLELDALFDRFYRADRARTSGSGFGIGLSIAKAIAESHGGKIAAQNLDNTAIRFTVRL